MTRREWELIVQIHNAYLRGNIPLLSINLIIAILWFAFYGFRPETALAQDISELDYREHFNPYMPTLVIKYKVAYRLFGLNLVHLADALVYATDGEWLNESTGEWLRAYLLIFHLDTLEDPSEIGHGRYSIHNRLATVLLKPSLEPIIFAKRDFLHVDTFFSTMEVYNTEIFSVESGKNDYIKIDFLSRSVMTNLDQFTALADQRKEVLRFMKMISSVYSGDTNSMTTNTDFNISVFTDNTLVTFNVKIAPKLQKVDVLDSEYSAIYFKAKPAPEFSGKGRELMVWVAPFRYVAEMTEDPELIWMANNTFELGMIPLRSEFGLKLGRMRCSLSRINLETDFENSR